MKQSILGILCVLQIFAGSMANAMMGDSRDIAKYIAFSDLNVSGHKIYTGELRKFYGQRGNRAVWFEGGNSNYKMEIYTSYAQDARDISEDNRGLWVPMAADYYSDANSSTWITSEITATYSMLMYLNGRGVRDYTNLNKALEGDGYDLQYYLQTLRLRDGSVAPPSPGGGSGGGILGRIGSIFGVGGDDTTPQPPAPILDPAPPVDGSVVQQPVGVSTMRYANDPTPADVNALYQGASQSIWLDVSSRPNAMAAALRQLLRDAGSQGLNPDDYWDANLETLYSSAAGMEFESRASMSFLRYVNHLTRGRIDPASVDKQLLQFQLKKFDDTKTLLSIVRGSADSFAASVLQLAPQLPQYQNLVSVLNRLTILRDSGQWKKISDPGRNFKMGDNSPTIGAVRTRLSQLGYPGAGSGNIYDDQYAAVVKLFLASNGLPGTLDYRFWNSLNKSVDDRIQQVRLNMEKIRWIPRDARTRYAFVNLAAQEIRLMDQGQLVMKFRTVNGMPDRPTPSMLQQIRSVILNPTWTIPPKLALIHMKEDPLYAQKNKMYVLDAATNQYLPNLDGLDMTKFTDSSATTRYYLIQGPGNGNALGVIKFPLSNMDGSSNKDDIYMHDTNERNLFPIADRLRSSGCIRLQMPIEFGEQVLKDKGMTADDIKARVPWDDATQIVSQKDTNQAISLPKSLPVYILFLTAEQSDEGGARFFEDAYGLDAKILVALKTSL